MMASGFRPRSCATQIFTPFFTTREKGTGLGLAFVREIVRDHGGEVMVKEADGGGSVFSFELPAAPVTAILFTDPKFLDHDPGPDHVESPARLDAIMGELGRAPLDGLGEIETPRAATDSGDRGGPPAARTAGGWPRWPASTRP